MAEEINKPNIKSTEPKAKPAETASNPSSAPAQPSSPPTRTHANTDIGIVGETPKTNIPKIPIDTKEKTPEQVEKQKIEDKTSAFRQLTKEDEKPETKEDEAEEGEVVLPHQENDLKPDEIIEIDQEPPEEEKIFAPEEIKDVISGSALPKEEKIKEIKKESKKPSLTPEPITKSSGLKPDRQVSEQGKNSQISPATEKPFKARYLSKLREQLGLANTKRRKIKQANLEKIMEYARQTQKITNDDVERITGVKDTQAEKYLNQLVKQGKLVRFGKTKTPFINQS